MEQVGITGLILIILNIAVSYKGLSSDAYLYKYAFRVDRIRAHGEYYRLVTSGFVHVSWMHLLFNMLTLYFFSDVLEKALGPLWFLLIYLAALLGGNLFSLFMHRHHGGYTAVGASGAVSGIVFACIALFPHMSIGFFGLPFIPAWVYGAVYVLVSIYGIQKKRDNIGHDAHLGGGIVGMLTAIALVPQTLEQNYIAILLVLLPALVFMVILFKRPGISYLNPVAKRPAPYQTIDDKFNEDRHARQVELDSLLDKINRKGLDSLSKKERRRLDELSR